MRDYSNLVPEQVAWVATDPVVRQMLGEHSSNSGWWSPNLMVSRYPPLRLTITEFTV